VFWVYPIEAFYHINWSLQSVHLRDYSARIPDHIYLPSNEFLQCSNSQPEYISISPGFKLTSTPICAPGLTIDLYSSITLFSPVGSMYIGHRIAT
jgi:hypothetical protein